jgi:hypothetical protein
MPRRAEQVAIGERQRQSEGLMNGAETGDRNRNGNGNGTLRHAKRIVVAVIGGTILLLGVLMLVLPGPGLLVMALGLSILASEFVWAKRFLQHVRDKIAAATGKKSTTAS